MRPRSFPPQPSQSPIPCRGGGRRGLWRVAIGTSPPVASGPCIGLPSASGVTERRSAPPRHAPLFGGRSWACSLQGTTQRDIVIRRWRGLDAGRGPGRGGHMLGSKVPLRTKVDDGLGHRESQRPQTRAVASYQHKRLWIARYAAVGSHGEACCEADRGRREHAADPRRVGLGLSAKSEACKKNCKTSLPGKFNDTLHVAIALSTPPLPQPTTCTGKCTLGTIDTAQA